jgi:hypothetical protein
MKSYNQNEEKLPFESCDHKSPKEGCLDCDAKKYLSKSTRYDSNYQGQDIISKNQEDRNLYEMNNFLNFPNNDKNEQMSKDEKDSKNKKSQGNYIN